MYLGLYRFRPTPIHTQRIGWYTLMPIKHTHPRQGIPSVIFPFSSSPPTFPTFLSLASSLFPPPPFYTTRTIINIFLSLFPLFSTESTPPPPRDLPFRWRFWFIDCARRWYYANTRTLSNFLFPSKCRLVSGWVSTPTSWVFVRRKDDTNSFLLEFFSYKNLFLAILHK